MARAFHASARSGHDHDGGVEDALGGVVVLSDDGLVRPLEQEIAGVGTRLRVGGKQKTDKALRLVGVRGSREPRVDLRSKIGGRFRGGLLGLRLAGLGRFRRARGALGPDTASAPASAMERNFMGREYRAPWTPSKRSDRRQPCRALKRFCVLLMI